MDNQEIIKKPKLLKAYPTEEYQGRVLLAGSSFMENWETWQEDLEPLDTMNVAIGGTKVADWQDMYEELIVPYNPEAVVIYVGSNDIDGSSKSKTGDAVFEEIKELFTREKVWSDSGRCNELMEAYCEQEENYYFIDCTEALLQDDGRLRENIYTYDKLYFNEEGYEIWASVIGPYLRELLGSE